MTESSGNELELRARKLENALISYYARLAEYVNELVDQYDRMPYKTSEDKGKLAKKNRQIEDYTQQLDACVAVATAGGVELPPVKIEHQGKRSRDLWRDRKPVSGTTEGSFTV